MGQERTSAWNTIWVQLDGPNTKPEMLSCYGLDTVTNPLGAVSRDFCYNPVTDEYDSVGERIAAPGAKTVTISGLTYKAASLLQRASRKKCPIPIYVNGQECAPRGSFVDYDLGKVLEKARMTQITESGMVNIGDQVQTMEAYDFDIEKIEEYFSLLINRRATAETQVLQDIAFCNAPSCAGACGPAADKCDFGVAVAASAVAPAFANILYTVDGGMTWTAVVGPFATGSAIASVVCFPWDRDTHRIVVANGTTAAGVVEVSWTDDLGVTWNDVLVGGTAAAFALHSGALFALDRDHIWLVNNVGEIFFSDDGAVTWTEQDNDGNIIPLNYIRFVDKDVGVAVGGATGASQVILTTVDGGWHWTTGAFTGVAATVMAYCVELHDQYRFFVGFENGQLWYTTDGGVTWAQRVITIPVGQVSAGPIADIMRVDEYCMYLATGWVGAAAAPYGSIQQTVDGGFDWKEWPTDLLTPAGARQNAVWACSFNQAFSVGGLSGATATIYEVHEQGSP